MPDQTPEEKAAAEREEAIKRMEQSVPTPTQQEIDDAVSGKTEAEPQVKKASEAAPSPSYQTRAVKPKDED